MGKRMEPVEKIAREICWREFVVRPTDITKAAYWRTAVCPSARAEYMRDARIFVWAYRNIPTDLINEAAQEPTP